MKKMMLSAVAALACLAAGATDYTWQGGAPEGDLWTVPANWGVSSGYPSTSGDVVIFNGSADVTLDSGTVTDIAYVKVTAGDVTLNAISGSSLRLNRTGYNVDGGSIGTSGLVIYEGAKLNLNVPLDAGDGRFDKWGQNASAEIGALAVSNSITKTGGNMNLAQGTNWFGNGAVVDVVNLIMGVTVNTKKMFTYVEGNASINATLLSFTNGGTDVPDVELEQSGEDSSVTATTLELAGGSHNGEHLYKLEAGKLTANLIAVGGSNNKTTVTNCHFRQTGGISTFGKVLVGRTKDNSAGKPGIMALTGGEMNFTGAAADFVVDAGSMFDFSGGTLGWAGDFDPTAFGSKIAWSGTVSVTNPANSSFTWAWPAGNKPTTFVKNGEGEIAFPGDTQGVGLKIAKGAEDATNTLTIASGTAIVPPSGTYEPWSVVKEKWTAIRFEDYTARISAPVGLTLPGTEANQIFFPKDDGKANITVAHNFKAGSIVFGAGVYTPSYTGAIVGDETDAVVVPYVWVGPATGGDWSEGSNWQINGAAAGAYPPAGAPVDISTATSINLDVDATVSYLVAMPTNAANKTTLTGDHVLSFGKWTHSNGKTYGDTGVYVPAGKTLELDVPTVAMPSIIGGGIVSGADAAVEYVWTGAANDGGLWSTPGNWSVGVGYPSATNHIVVFNGDATVAFDKSTTNSYVKVTSGTVTIATNSANNATLTFGTPGGVLNASGFTIAEGATLNFAVPLSEISTRFDRWGKGELKLYGTVLTKSAATGAANPHWYICAGTTRFGRDFVLEVTSENTHVMFGNGDYGNVYTYIEENARLSLANQDATLNTLHLTTGGNTYAPDAKVYQTGAGSVVDVDYLYLNGEARSSQPNTLKSGDGHCYTLSNGTLTASYLHVLGNRNAVSDPANGYEGYNPTNIHYVQEGGVSTFGGAWFLNGSGALRGGVMNYTGATGPFAVTNGTFEVSGGATLNLSDAYSPTDWVYLGRDGYLEMNGGTLGWPTNFNPSANKHIQWSGVNTVTVPADCNVTWDWTGVTAAPGTAVSLGGDHVFSDETVTNGIGVAALNGETITVASGTVVVNPEGSYAPWKVVLGHGSMLKLQEPTARLALPLDLEITGSGKVQMYSAAGGMGGGYRGTVVAHSLVVGGVAKEKGRYTGANSFLDAGTVLGTASAIIVPYVWTGEGADDNWATPGNWEGGVVPPSGASVDISRAETVTLDSDVQVDCLVAMPNNAARKTTVSGTGTITTVADAYQCGVYVPVGCELVLNVNFRRATSVTANPALVFGGGRLELDKTVPAATSGGSPLLAVDGTLAIAGSVVFEPASGSTMDYLSVWSGGPGLKAEVLVEDGAKFNSGRLYEANDGFTGAVTVRQTGGEAVFAQFYMQNHNSATAAEDLNYILEDGEMTVASAMNLGRSVSTSKPRYPGGSFEMTGGTLTVAGINGGENQNYVRLSGGDVYLTGNCGASLDAPAETNRNEYTFYLGGAKIYASGSYRLFSSGNIWLTGENGDVEFVMTDGNMGITAASGSVAGPGGFVVSGASGRTFTAKGTYTNEGTIRVKGGAGLDLQTVTINGPSALVVESGSTVNMYAVSGGTPCVVEKDFDSIELAAENCLTLDGQALTVQRLTVGGVDRAPGRYSFGSGTVTVVGKPGLLLIFN